MNKAYITRLLTLLAAVSLAGLTGCFKDDCEAIRIFHRYDPVYMAEAEMRQDIEVEAPRELENPGKIYFYQNYLLVNEQKEGVHVIDNSDPASPQILSFIRIPGNVDMAVRGNILYADNYMDLVSVDISDPLAPRQLGRTEAVFPLNGIHPTRGYIVDYVRSEVTQERPCNDGQDFFFQDDVLWARPETTNAFNNAGGDSRAAAALGVGGSLARFTLAANHLYTVDESSLHVFGLRNPEQPERLNQIHFGWGVETIFPYGDHLFIGSRTGMFIFNNQNPTNPELRSVFEHANACDPVYVDGDIAYVTLRDGTECQDFNNQLDIVDISNLDRPVLMHTYPMHHPIGLSVSEGHLYLCEDDQGLKVFDVSELSRVAENQVAHLSTFQAYDVITIGSQKLAMVIGADGLMQFDITDPANPRELSVLPVVSN